MFGTHKRQRLILHLTWIAFFLTFVTWFNMAPFNTTLMRALNLSHEQINILMICNVALTIPARIIIGSLVDHYGPRIVFTAILVLAGLVSLQFSIAASFEECLVSRLLMGIVGAGFVVGIKMIAEWFPPDKMGKAQGIYAGWGNFGAAVALFSLPPIAVLFPEETGWRIAVAFTGILCLIWAVVYHRYAIDFPESAVKFKVAVGHSIQVTSLKDLYLQILLLVPVYGAVGAFIWKLSGHPLRLLPPTLHNILIGGCLIIFAFHVLECLRSNLPRLKENTPQEDDYEFSQIFILSLVYALTFGSELAVVSMFPEFLEEKFGLSVTMAGILGSSFAVMNLVTRPSGGWLSDLLGRRRTLVIMVSGSFISYMGMGEIDAHWPLWQVIGLGIACSIFRQAGNGACFAAVPLIRKDLTGKLAGMVGAYGSIGAVGFLTIFGFVGEQTFFNIIGGYALIVLLSLCFLKSFKNLHTSFNSR